MTLKTKILSAILVLTSVCVSAFTLAEPIDIYEYHSLVATQDRPERNQATSDGLAEIIVRASGQSRVLSDSGVIKALGNPSRYLVEYRYKSTDKTIEVDGKVVPAYDLLLKFSGSSVETLLRDLQLPIWPVNRPSVMVWLVIDDGIDKKIVSDQNLPEGIASIKASGTQRGLPIVTPLGDLEDQVAVSVDKFWQLDEISIRSASERYSPESILVGRLTKLSQSRWRASWLLLNGDQLKPFDGTGSELADVIADGVGVTADYFFQLYGYEPTGGALQTFMFSIGDVSNFGSYVKVMKYLEGVTVVRGVDLVSVSDKGLVLRVATEVDLKALEQAIALDKRLVKNYQSPSSASSSYPSSQNVNTPASMEGATVSAVLGSESNPVVYSWRK